MPTYEYVCSKCGHEFEQFQPMSDKPLRRCPKCKKLALKRLIGRGGGLIFKGTGFYVTDYKKGSPPPKEGAGESKPAAPAADSKPAASGGEAKPASTPAKAPPASPS